MYKLDEVYKFADVLANSMGEATKSDDVFFKTFDKTSDVERRDEGLVGDRTN